MRRAWLGLFLLLVGCSNANDPAKLIVGSWQPVDTKIGAGPITYNKDGTYIQTMSQARYRGATFIIKGKYRVEGNDLISSMSDMQVYGLTPAQLSQEKANFNSQIGKESRTKFTFANADELVAEAGDKKIIFIRVAGGQP